jgi:hypothetical protein
MRNDILRKKIPNRRELFGRSTNSFGRKPSSRGKGPYVLNQGLVTC